MIRWVVIGCLLLSSKLMALSDEMKTWMDVFNVSMNSTSGDVVHSQMGVHYLGGHGVVRSKVTSMNPVQIQLPQLSAGCGGIDFTMGAINIASKDAIKKSLKSIASNGAGYAFMLGIETVSPVVASNMKDVQTWANQLNQMNLNSCELSSMLVAGAWPRNTAAKEKICAHASAGDGMFNDLIEAKHGCRERDKRNLTIQDVKKKNQDLLVGDYNVAWTVISKLHLSDETKRLLMNLTGTVVVYQDQLQVFPAKFKESFDLLLRGGSILNAYVIDKDNINIVTRDFRLPAKSAFLPDIENTLASLAKKIANEGAERSSLTDKEKALLQSTRFPIGSLLSLMGQWSGAGSDMASLHECAELIAFERVSELVDEILRNTISQASTLESSQVDGTALKQYLKELRESFKVLHHLQYENYEKINQKHQLINYLMNMDREMRGKEHRE